MSAPTGHPAWCTIRHAPGWPIHSALIGETVTAEDDSVSVELNDAGDGRGSHVSMATWTADNNAFIEFTATQAREVAGFLTAAADALEANGGDL